MDLAWCILWCILCACFTGLQEGDRQSLLATWLLMSDDSLALDQESSAAPQVECDAGTSQSRSRSPRVRPTNNETLILEAKARSEKFASITWCLDLCPIAHVMSHMHSNRFAKLYVGITRCPVWRFCECGLEDRPDDTWIMPHIIWWARMQVIAACMGDAAAELEIQLIAKCKRIDSDKIANVRRGGEQAQPDCLTYVYVCLNTAEEHVQIALANARYCKSKRQSSGK